MHRLGGTCEPVDLFPRFGVGILNGLLSACADGTLLFGYDSVAFNTADRGFERTSTSSGSTGQGAATPASAVHPATVLGGPITLGMDRGRYPQYSCFG